MARTAINTGHIEVLCGVGFRGSFRILTKRDKVESLRYLKGVTSFIQIKIQEEMGFNHQNNLKSIKIKAFDITFTSRLT